jgi:hypothetical protein
MIHVCVGLHGRKFLSLGPPAIIVTGKWSRSAERTVTRGDYSTTISVDLLASSFNDPGSYSLPAEVRRGSGLNSCHTAH